ncbi:HD-GYP domain-containing protein [Paenibacillus lactis]|uniref:HD-GYP domain-containing protein (C-di-GMP phosphodiesterase class II) n=1 Tax=Paenibacillus lactis TaxID=228574 RepID=A0ABS4FI30_9BACL|nr:HD-GYP domain-containing protein [Paenibacillus lactis]MBP1895932.1 HD-GYP domain-containing protein (c-di-GMP phosphodiesterase class II) [Paenibacillus lactis]
MTATALNDIIGRRVIHIDQFIGRRLKRNIYSRQGSLLLSQNCILDHHHINLLHQHGIDLWKEDPQYVTEILTKEAVLEVQAIFEKIRYQSEQLSNQDIQEAIIPKIQQLCINNLSNVILELSKKDNYTYRHCIGVSLISYLIGKWLGLKDEELQNLAIAGLLHDLGKIKISDSILNKTSSLSADEYAEMKLHTHFGYEMIRNISEMTEQQALVALQHHEREDGSGYPFRIAGVKITLYSKIVAVADVFHTMISERTYKKPIPLYQVFEEIYNRGYKLFDSMVVHCFIMNMMIRMVGDHVILTDGQVARIVMLHSDDLINPLVEANGNFYDLRNSEHKILDFVYNQ